MKHNRIIRYGFFCAILFAATVLFPDDAFARRDKSGEYFLKPQVGLWFGPITPVYTTAEVVKTDLGGGLFFRYNMPWKPMKIGFDASYQSFGSDGVNKLLLVPTYMSGVFRIPINIPLVIQAKIGAGSCYTRISPDAASASFPMGMVGVEVSFPAGKIVNIGLRIDYMLIYNGYIKGAKRDGHVIDAGITLFFNL